jgi:hypothetical protein
LRGIDESVSNNVTSFIIPIDIDKLIKFYNKSLQSNDIVAKISDLLGLNNRVIEMWIIKRPSQVNFNNCFQGKTFRQFISESNDKSFKNSLNKASSDTQAMCAAQRIYVSLFLWRSMKAGNRSGIEKVMNDFLGFQSFSLLENLKRKTLIHARKMKSFCEELGISNII